jgi:hypothetical protein
MALSVGVFALGGCDSGSGSGAPADVGTTPSIGADAKTDTIKNPKAVKSIKNFQGTKTP